MILWLDGAHDAAENMRRDRTLLERCARPGPGRPEAVLRLFAFDPPGITLGYAQVPERTLDLERCRAAGLAWAVRPTGGRAILHVEEWTYSLSATIDDPAWGGGMGEAYDRVSRMILASLRSLGVDARLASRPRPGRGVPSGGAAACFASAARHEILLGGRKLVGSAQRRAGAGMLQQGSVLIGPGHLRLPEYLAVPEAARAREREALAAGSVHAAALSGEPLERWAASLASVLEGRARRVDGASGAFLLTPRETGSYTRASR